MGVWCMWKMGSDRNVLSQSGLRCSATGAPISVWIPMRTMGTGCVRGDDMVTTCEMGFDS